MMVETRWAPISVFVNGATSDPLSPPEYAVRAEGIIDIRGRVNIALPGHPCVRLPEEARPAASVFSADWWGFEHENYRSVKVESDGYVTIIEITKQQLLDTYLASLA